MKSRDPNRAPLYEAETYAALVARLAVNVRRLREAKGLTQEEFAFRCHELDPSMLRTIEAGEANVTVTTVARLCDGLGVDVLDLYAAAPPLTKRGPGRPKKSGG